jgi:thiamine transport system permease protein
METKHKFTKKPLAEDRLLRSKITEALDRFSSRKRIRYGVYFSAILVFFALILLPPLLGIAIKWDSMSQVLSQPELVSRALTAVSNSFLIALLVSAIDLLAGLPMAWIISRGKSKWLNILDTLSDIPFIVPTSALGFSLFLFWNQPGGISSLFENPLVSKGWLLVILLHFTFSYPVVVRVIVGALLDYKTEYENASRTLGAPPFMAARTVTFSIIKPSLIAAFVLAFARSLSETGATFFVAGTFETGPVFIRKMTSDGPIVFASFTLMAVAIMIFITIHSLGLKLRIPVKRYWPTFERKISYSRAAFSRNSVTVLVFFALVLVPSLFVALPALQTLLSDTFPTSFSSSGVWGDFWQSLALSYSVAAVVTILNIVIGLPMAIAIARRKLGSVPSTMMDLLVNVPLIVPSIALGVSLKIFWKESIALVPEILLLIFAHLAITYPYFVRSMSAAVERISPDMEEASRTLGAKPLGVFRTIVLPLTKYSILSGAIMMFTRSVSETGATLAVTSLRTAPVVIVDWVTQNLAGSKNLPEVSLACGYLIALSFIILLALRLLVKGKGRY